MQQKAIATKPILIPALLMLLLISSVFSPIPAEAQSLREQKITASGTLRVCIWPDYFSITYKNKKSGKLEGIDIDLSREFAKDLGVNVEYVPTHFGIFMNDIEQDKCDLAMFGVGITEARAQRIDYSTPYLSSGMYGIVNKSNPIVTSWETMDQPGVVVCVQKGTYMEGAMRHSLQHAELMTVVKHSQREIEVHSGRADVFITDYPYGQKMINVYDWSRLLTPASETEQFKYAYAVAKDQPQWLARVNRFVASIQSDGRLEHFAHKNGLLPIALFDEQ